MQLLLYSIYVDVISAPYKTYTYICTYICICKRSSIAVYINISKENIFPLPIFQNSDLMISNRLFALSVVLV